MPGLFSRNQAPAARDYRPDDNPTTPLGVFFTVLRINFGNIVKVNFLYFLFMIPTIAWLIIHVLMLNNTLENAAILEQELQLTDLIPMVNMLLLGCIVTELPLGPAKCGLAYVMRFLSQDEHSFVVDDFFAAYKANWKQGLVMNLITSCINALAFMAIVSYWVESATNSFFMVFVYALMIMMVVYIMMQQFFYPFIVTYDMSLYSIIRTTMILAISRLPLSLLSLVLTSLIGAGLTFYALMYNMSIGLTVGLLFFAILGYALNQLIRSSFVHAIFNDMLVTPDSGRNREDEVKEEEESGDSVLPEDRA